MQVVLLNNYPMSLARKRYAAGIYPGHHLWGLTENGPDRMTEWILPRASLYSVPGMRSKFGSILRKVIFRLVGDPIQQVSAVIQTRRGGVILAADQFSAQALGYLRRARLLRRHVIAVVHHPPKSRREIAALSGMSGLLPLSPFVQERLLHVLNGPLITEPVPWGPKTDSAVCRNRPHAACSYDFVAAGRANRE
jgi:hypothetical protein